MGQIPCVSQKVWNENAGAIRPPGLVLPRHGCACPMGRSAALCGGKNGETGRLLQHLVSKLTLVSLSVKRKVGKRTPAGEQGGPPGGRGAPVSAGYAAGRCLPALCQWGGYRQGKAPGQAVTLLRRFSVWTPAAHSYDGLFSCAFQNWTASCHAAAFSSV